MKSQALLIFIHLCLCQNVSASYDAASSVRYFDLYQKSRESNGSAQLKHLEDAIAIYGKSGDLWYQLAQARLSAKQYAAAEQAYSKALEYGAFKPKLRANIFYDIACANALLGKSDSAMEFLQKSLSEGFRDLEHLRTDKDLESLHKDKRWEAVAATKDVSKLSRDDAWRYDLWLLTREVQRIHIDPYRRYSKKDQDAWAKNLSRSISKLSDQQIAVEFGKYMRKIGDGHTAIRISKPGSKVLPIQAYSFSDGLFITAADTRFADLAGAQVLKVEGKTIEELLPICDLIAAQDNSQGLLARLPIILVNPYVLNGLGIAKSEKELLISIRDKSGKVRDVTLPADSDGPNAQWALGRPDEGVPLYLQNLSKPYWFEFLPESKSVYFQYNAVREDSSENIEAFSTKLFEFVEKKEVERLIIDARWNGGGNSFLNRPFVNGIIGCKKVNKLGKLFVIVGRQTFSAAQNFVTDIERACDAIFVGEPTGSAPNFVGESIRFSLPHSKLTGTISDLYWQRSWPMDERKWISPDLPAEPKFELYKSNRDPAMEVIYEYLKGK